MEKDLKMKGHDYNVGSCCPLSHGPMGCEKMQETDKVLALTIFFVSYAGAEPFTNLVLKRITPRVFFTSVVIVWGFCMLCMGLVTSYKGLLVARFFLGITEAGLYPGVQYYLRYRI
jgi:MFS family permease